MARCTLLLLAVLPLAAGCSTHAHRLADVRTAFHSGDLAGARARIDAALPKNPREADVLKLDQASVLLSAGKPRDAEKLLREVRDHFDHLEKKDLAEGALSLVTDDQVLAYSGDDHEKVLVRVYLALANLMADGQDAEAYALQIGAKQQELIQTGKSPDGKNPRQSYRQVAVGSYLRAALREQTHTDYGDAARALEQVCSWVPEFRQGQNDLIRVREGRHSARGNGVVYVVAFVGRGPYKEERYEIVTQAALLIADRLISAFAKHSLPPTLAPIKVPRVVVPPSEVQTIAIMADRRPAGTTETITDIGRMASEQCEAMLPMTIGRAVARRVVKKASIHTVKEVLPESSATWAIDLALSGLGVLWEGTESADTRCWGLLPNTIQVLRVELPAGAHELHFQPLGVNGAPVGQAVPTSLAVQDGRNTYVLVNFPGARMAGQVVVSGR